MREILFRGKWIDNGEWVYGNLNYGTIKTTSIKDSYYISDFDVNPWDKRFYPIIPESVGQYTGLTDKNGKKIFEGDIVKHESGATVLFHKVVFERRNGCAYFGAVMGEYETWGFCNSFPPTLVEVVGNIHDNPELLEEEEE